MCFQIVHFALVGGAHGAARAVDDGAGLGAAAALELEELAEAGLENALQGAGGVAVVDRALVQRAQVGAAPEVALELFGLGARAADGEGLAENPVPGHERHDEQQRHDDLHHGAGVPHQRENGKVLGDVHCLGSDISSDCRSETRSSEKRSRTASGRGMGRWVWASTQAMVMSAWASNSSPRRAFCSKTRRARPAWLMRAVTVSR